MTKGKSDRGNSLVPRDPQRIGQRLRSLGQGPADHREADATRRGFILGAIVGTAGTFLASNWGPWTADRIGERIQQNAETEEKRRKARHIFEELFGPTYSTRHYDHGGHSDNVDLGLSFAGPFGMADLAFFENSKGELRRQSNLETADQVVYGGPNSTPFTRLAWEFWGPNTRQLTRRSDPSVPLRFIGESNELNVKQIPDHWIEYVKADGKIEQEEAWPMVDLSNGRTYAPRPKTEAGSLVKDGRTIKTFLPLDNYVTITRVPNFVGRPPDKSDHRLWPSIVVIDGSNGIGTRAAELLQQPQGLKLLQDLKQFLQGADSFQVILRAYDLEQTGKGMHRFREIEPVSGSFEQSVCKIELSTDSWLAAHKRLWTWVADRVAEDALDI